MSHIEHRIESKSIVARCGVLTLSDTRTLADDSSGARIRDALEHAGHQVARRELIADEPAQLSLLLDEWTSSEAIITTGGTGISRRDSTIEVVEAAIDQTIPGFGELFRMLSFREIGSAAMLSRATAGLMRGKPIFALPGSTSAVDLAMKHLIVPELRHLLGQLRK
jgi:molybdenum cofactor biosynthesis protein B